MTVENQEELLQQQPQQRQSQLPDAALPNPWPHPWSAENESRQGVSREGCPKTGWYCRLDGDCGYGEDLNSPSVVQGKCIPKRGGQSGREQDGNGCKRGGIGTEWRSGRLLGLGCEAAF